MKNVSYKNIAIFILLFFFFFKASTIAQEIEALKKGVVKINTATFEGRQKTGTGFIVRQDDKMVIIVTASHVVEGGQSIDVEFFTARGKLFVAKLLGMEGGDPQGLAVLSLTGEIPEDISVLKMNSSIPVRAGDEVIIIGFPNAGGPWAVSKGEIIGRKGRIITFSGAIEEGNSGGPLIKGREVIGVVAEARLPFAAAVPAIIAQYFLESWGIKFTVKLRSEPASVSLSYIIKMCQEKGFSHPADFLMSEASIRDTYVEKREANKQDIIRTEGIIGGFENEFETRSIHGETIVIDYATSLMWQPSGTVNDMYSWKCKGYIKELNREKFAGFSDWRLPTVDELASLMTSVGTNKGLYIDTLFDSKQSECWSSDFAENYRWMADYGRGILAPGYHAYTRVVRTLKSESEISGKPINRIELARSGLSSEILENTRIVFLIDQHDTTNIYIIKSDGTNRKRLTNDFSKKLFPSWSPDGKKIAYNSDWSDMQDKRKKGWFVMNRDGTEQRYLEKIGDGDGSISWSPDGKQVIFAKKNDSSRDLFTLNQDNTNLTKLADTKQDEMDPTWSPDGQKIAFRIEDEIHVMNSDGSNPIIIFKQEKFALSNKYFRNFTWSPTGKKIAFLGTFSMHDAAFVIDTDGSNIVRLTVTDMEAYTSPRWSPDGKKLVFKASTAAEASDIYVVNVDGTGLRNLTQSSAGYDGPSWSPDGSKITFASDRFGNWEIYVMNADGSNQVRLTNTPEDERNPVWSPFFK